MQEPHLTDTECGTAQLGASATRVGHGIGASGNAKARQKRKDASAISEKQTTEVADKLYKSSARRGRVEGDWRVELG